MIETSPEFPQAIGECIYCGQREGDLSDEHVIPFGLGGTWILRKASCAHHRNVTSAFEADVLNRAWGPVRAALGVRTRRKKRRKEGYDVRLEVGDGVKSVTVGASDHPAPMAWPVYAPPGQTPRNPKIPGTSVIRLRASVRLEKARALGAKYGARAVRFPYPEPVKFARFLGKIGYCFAIACDGLGQTRGAPIVKAVLSNSTDIFRFVGNVETVRDFTGDTEQEVAMGRDEGGRVAYIRLIGNMRAPEYVVYIDAPAG